MTGNTANLRRAALRAAKMLDRYLTEDDALLGSLEGTFANGSDDDLAEAVLAVVHAVEGSPTPSPYVVMDELLAWRAQDRVTGTASDEATLRRRDVADRLLSGWDGTDRQQPRHVPPQAVAALRELQTRIDRDLASNAETTEIWGVRFYGRGPFVLVCDSRGEAEAERDGSDDKHRPAVLVRASVRWAEFGPRKEAVL